MPDIMGEPDERPTKRIYLVRHGETALNAEHKMRGWDNPPLNEDGEADAEKVAEVLAALKLDKIYCSDLKRATQTANTVNEAQQTARPLEPTLNLRTIDVGMWTGRPVEQVEPRLAQLQAAWRTKPDTEAPGGESFTSFQRRQLAAWREILDGKGAQVAVVSHLRCCVWALGWALQDRKPLAGDDLLLLDRLTQKTGRFSILTFSGREGLKVEDVNTLTLDPGGVIYKPEMGPRP